MIRWLLDTDHVSLQERGHPTLRKRLEAVPHDAIAVSVVTMEEMLRGRLALLARRTRGEPRVRAYRKLVESVHFFSSITIVPFDATCERKYEALLALRLRIGSQDLRIAATALVNELIVVTRNWKDFGRVPELALEDWTISGERSG